MEENSIKKCPECGQENENGYSFCKNCGAPLNTEAPLRSEVVNDPAKAYNAAPFAAAAGAGYSQNARQGGAYSAMPADNIDGISVEDISAFAGKKAPAVIKKFFAMQISGSSVSWCWPAAVLGFLFGPIGVAIWFFYRKMYKYAFALAGIGAVFSIAAALIEGKTVDLSAYFEGIFAGGAVNLNDFIIAAENWRAVLAEGLIDIVRISAAIVGGLFSFSVYKRFAVQKIKDFRIQNGDPRYYGIGLSMLGGTSGGMACLGVLLLITAESIGNLLSQLINTI